MRCLSGAINETNIYRGTFKILQSQKKNLQLQYSHSHITNKMN